MMNVTSDGNCQRPAGPALLLDCPRAVGALARAAGSGFTGDEGHKHVGLGLRWATVTAGGGFGIVAVLVAGGASQFELVDQRVTARLKGGDVVVFEEFGASAVAADLVAFLDDASLPRAGVALAARRVDRMVVGIVDQHPQERRWSDLLHDTARQWGAVVEAAPITADVDDDLGVGRPTAGGDQGLDGVGVLLGHRGIRATGRAQATVGEWAATGHDPGGQPGDQQPGHHRRQPQREGDHPVRFVTPPHRPLAMRVRVRTFEYDRPGRKRMPERKRKRSHTLADLDGGSAVTAPRSPRKGIDRSRLEALRLRASVAIEK